MDKFFAFFGKVILVFLLLGVIGGGAYYFGQKKGTPNPSPTPQESPTVTNSTIPAATGQAKKTVEGGVPKSAGLAYDQYSLEVGSDWVVSRETSQAYEKLTLSKGEYQLIIMQGATGGAMCLYPGDPDFVGPSSRYTTFAEFKSKDGWVLRRGGTNDPPYQGKIGFTVCQVNVEGNFGQPTQYGHIGYSVPTLNKEIILEMDAIVSSLKKK